MGSSVLGILLRRKDSIGPRLCRKGKTMWGTAVDTESPGPALQQTLASQSQLWGPNGEGREMGTVPGKVELLRG